MNRGLLLLILGSYIILAWNFASRTPPWQVPDEPAHYNYVRFIAATRRLPVLQPGDYDQNYLSEIVSRGFPPELSIDPLRYEFHQPPLYYLLMVPVFLLSGGSLLPLRLASAALGLLQILLAYAAVRRLFPERPAWAIGVAAVFAFIPQHVAMNSGVNNDALAETLILSLWLWIARELHGHRRHAWIGGLLLGAGFLTKTTVYPMALVALVAVLARAALESRPWPERFRRLLPWLLPAFALGALWWVRNSVVYGWPDFLGLQQHDRVVVGQPRTAEWIARFGLAATLDRFRTFTFQSFWGQFGWMGVVLDARWYLLFAWLTVLGLLGLALHLGRHRQASPLWGLRGLLLLLAFGLTAGTYLGYNLSFVQHQGRYLFPALLPIALGLVVGWLAWTERGAAEGLGAACGLGIIGLGWAGITYRDPPVMLLLLLAGTGLMTTLAARLPALRSYLALMALLGAFALDLYLILWTIPSAFGGS
ncbi:MAG TPA: glycosyltransferase family 39 protein [Thermoflexus sp.]|nr:glycosyltransferase family 39 protein [Thermoflexus sp.]